MTYSTVRTLASSLTVPEQNGRRFFLFDTSKVGNGNQGHEGKEYGTELAPDQKRALLEYLKDLLAGEELL